MKSAFLPIIFSPIDDRLQAKNGDIAGYDSIFGKKEYKKEEIFDFETEENNLKKAALNQNGKKVIAKNAKVTKSLFEEIETNDEQLKFEYIQMVKNGKEQEHMKYLLEGLY